MKLLSIKIIKKRFALSQVAWFIKRCHCELFIAFCLLWSVWQTRISTRRSVIFAFQINFWLKLWRQENERRGSLPSLTTIKTHTRRQSKYSQILLAANWRETLCSKHEALSWSRIIDENDGALGRVCNRLRRSKQLLDTNLQAAMLSTGDWDTKESKRRENCQKTQRDSTKREHVHTRLNQEPRLRPHEDEARNLVAQTAIKRFWIHFEWILFSRLGVCHAA